MTGSGLDQRVGNPVGFVRERFQEACGGTGGNTSSNPQHQHQHQHPPPPQSFIPGVREAFLPYLLDPSRKEEVPCLNDTSSEDITHLPDGSLVRYIGMVRDMLNPEYFTGAYRKDGAWQTTKYQDFAKDDLSEASETVMWERKPLFCVAVTGEAAWVRPGAEAAKHQLEEMEVFSSDRKRSAPDQEEGVREDGDDDAMMECDPAGQAKRRVGGKGGCCAAGESCCGTQQQQQQQQPSDDSMMEVDLGTKVNQNEGEKPCLVKIYETADESGAPAPGLEGVKLNDVVEVIGVLGVDPRLALFQSGQFQEGEEVTQEDLANNPPASQVPRVHVIVGRKVQCYQHLMEEKFARNPVALALRQDKAKLEAARAKAVDLVARHLQGDRLAAEYLLIHLLSSCRRDAGANTGIVVGKHALNLTGSHLSGKECAALEALLRSLVPRCQSLPLSLQKLNAWPLWPRKDYRVSRLVGGPLLLADQTHLLLDETQLKEGQLAQVGVQNFQALKNLMENQTLEADFQFYRLPIPCNVPITVVSTTKSLLPCDTCVQIKPQHQQEAAAAGSPSEADLNEIRAYLAHCWLLDYAIPEEVSSVLQQDFVQQRQKDPRSVGAEHFHRTLTLSRLLAQSHGEGTLTVETYKKFCHMEDLRKAAQS
ncbi:mini-chromosome maintenance complex-binding protein [Chloropicon primus]|nr:mini-chromosome maintenance complex-binding protein [Chloropicon primus]